ncbi:MAG: twin-arginine translocase subunit TatC [Hungatella sp.]|nr:twin-arginine translocase subunit TatC [Hungatella sp.]
MKEQKTKGKKKKKHQEQSMTLAGHLRELRNRLVICMICLVVSSLAGLNYAPRLVELLTDMGKVYGYSYVYIAPQELLMQYFSIALLAGVCITFPVILYHIWAFVQPGLQKNENFLFLSAIFFGLLCFAAGIVFAYKIMLPFMLHFLIGISAGSEIRASISVQNYITFLMTIFMIFGIVFELPVISVLLTQLRLLKVEWMKKGRRVIIIIIFVVAALITPPDIVSQIMVAIPMVGLYELSIIICSILMKFRKKETETDTDI